jgi:hypothetical protein
MQTNLRQMRHSFLVLRRDNQVKIGRNPRIIGRKGFDGFRFDLGVFARTVSLCSVLLGTVSGMFQTHSCGTQPHAAF